MNSRTRMQLLLMFALFACTVQDLRHVGDIKSVAVSGQVFCNGRPTDMVKVSIEAKKYGYGTQEISTIYAKENGTFFNAARDSDFTIIIPKVYFSHTCNCARGCYKKFGIPIPENYIAIGNNTLHQYDFGIVDLDVNYLETYTFCIRR